MDDIMPFGGGLDEGRLVEKLDHSLRRVQENPHPHTTPISAGPLLMEGREEP